MAKKENRHIIKLKSSESSHIYSTYKNKKNDPERMELKKFNAIMKKMTIHKEIK